MSYHMYVLREAVERASNAMGLTSDAQDFEEEAEDALSAVDDLIKASKRTILAFEALGDAPGLLKEVQARKECEAAMVAQKVVLARFGSQS
ncbi:hypothetical protein NG831_06370 [Xanthomonas sacchari]|uniref:hypothetical protein n=1 Tax=Xanthomonas sacchari TaxID=56458 RepID=UPI0022531A41|nr:hypothetical protein [Xanthomonas sacchari]MCW0413511.1 hypothetical protein [Xanthomonas sacchari]UYK67784.1 hypothetical protein NG831_06370 [Xanthomonas sacchari]